MILKLLDVIVGWLAAGALFALLGAAGGLVPVASHDDRTLAMRWSTRVAAGAVLLYVWLMALNRVGIPWNRTTVVAPLAIAAAFGLRRCIRAPSMVGGFRLPRWGELAAVVALGGLATLLVRPCLTMPDVVFHWGIKAHRYFLTGGVDYVFLNRSWNFNKHADYPNLVPDLFAAGAMIRGRFAEAVMLPWTLAYAALVAVGAREAFRRRLTPAAQATIAIVTLVSLTFVLDYMLGASPDLLLGGLMVMSVPAVLGASTPGRDWQTSVIAAVAAGAKYEGTPLAAILILARLWQRRRSGGEIGPGVWLRLGGLPVVVAGLWWVEVLGRGLAQGNRAGSLDLGRWRAVAAALSEALSHPAWHGFAWILLALPVLVLVRSIRPMAAVVLAQAGVYLFVYLSTPIGFEALIATSATRLLVHLVPAALVLVGLTLAGPRSAGPRSAGPYAPPATGVRGSMNP